MIVEEEMLEVDQKREIYREVEVDNVIRDVMIHCDAEPMDLQT